LIYRGYILFQIHEVALCARSEHISILAIKNFIAGITSGEFQADDRTFSAVIRKLEIIGEASKSISDEVRTSNPDIPFFSGSTKL